MPRLDRRRGLLSDHCLSNSVNPSSKKLNGFVNNTNEIILNIVINPNERWRVRSQPLHLLFHKAFDCRCSLSSVFYAEHQQIIVVSLVSLCSWHQCPEWSASTLDILAVFIALRRSITKSTHAQHKLRLQCERELLTIGVLPRTNFNADERRKRISSDGK